MFYKKLTPWRMVRQQYGNATFVPFVQISGGIFRVRKPDEVNRLEEEAQTDSNLYCIENTWNHEHFDLVLSDDPVENFYLNRAQAEAAQALWSHRLAAVSDKARTVLVNELHLLEFRDDTCFYDVYPTLRAWTQTEHSKPLDDLYADNNGGNALDMETLQFVSIQSALDLVRSSTDVAQGKQNRLSPSEG
jgi:hypothetical protein